MRKDNFFLNLRKQIYMKESNDWKEALQKATGYVPAVSSPESGTDNTASQPPKKQNLQVKVEQRGAQKSKATIIYGFDGTEQQLKDFATTLRKKIGTGGSQRGGEILLQGDWKERVIAIAQEHGWKAK